MKTWSETIDLPGLNDDDDDWSESDIYVRGSTQAKKNSRLLGSKEPKSDN